MAEKRMFTKKITDSRSESTAAQADQAGAYVPAAYTAPAAAPSFEDAGKDEDLPF